MLRVAAGKVNINVKKIDKGDNNRERKGKWYIEGTGKCVYDR